VESSNSSATISTTSVRSGRPTARSVRITGRRCSKESGQVEVKAVGEAREIAFLVCFDDPKRVARNRREAPGVDRSLRRDDQS